jgi:hypothetical protein
MKFILALLLLVFLPYVLGSLFFYGGARIIQKKRTILTPRAKGRTGFELPVIVDGKGAVYDGIDKIAVGCLLWFIALFFLVLGIMYRQPH